MGLDQTYLSLLISSLLILLSALECLLKITLKVAMSGWWHRCRTGERWQYRSSSSESERRMEHAESKMIRNQEKVWLHGWTTMLNIVEVRIPNFWSVCPYLSCRFFVQVTLEDSMELHEPRLIASNFHSAETHVGVDRLSRAAAQSVENWNSNRMSLVQSFSLSLLHSTTISQYIAIYYACINHIKEYHIHSFSMYMYVCRYVRIIYIYICIWSRPPSPYPPLPQYGLGTRPSLPTLFSALAFPCPYPPPTHPNNAWD